jgi:hypothetical protein
MADTKKTLVNFGLSLLRELVKEKPAAEEVKPVEGGAASGSMGKLDDIKLEDLTRKKVQLDQKERMILADVKKYEAEKRKLFEEGVRNASEREQRVLARRMKGLDQQAKNCDSMLQDISKQMRIVDGLIQIKERVRMNKELGLESIFQNMDLTELVGVIEQASVDGEVNSKNLDQVLSAMEKANAVSPQYSEDDDVLEIVRQMQLAREAADNPEALEQHFNEMEQKTSSASKEAAEDEL